MNQTLKYGYAETYQYKLDEERLDWLSNKTNRSKGQTLFLFQLVDGNFEKLKQLETKIKNCFVDYCPASKEKVEEVMQMRTKSDWFTL